MLLLRILLKNSLPFAIPLLVVIAVLTMARRQLPFLHKVPSWVWWAIILVLVLVWLAVILFRWLAEKKKSAAIEKGILSQAQWNVDQAAPGRRAEIEEIRKSLAEAMATLQQGPEGKKALYTLPWYLIIGPPAIGKTTAVTNSGLNFPNMTTARRMRGAGGTRNCDWWFSTDAILLDTAGRYAQSQDRSETEEEWFSFLDLLKKNRGKGPINGLILGYSMETLIDSTDQKLVDDARELRQRMDEVMDRLGWSFPVYVLFTKCDLVAGFADYFSSLSPSERQQVWGATYERIPGADQKAAERFTIEFDRLVRRLRELRPRRVAGTTRSEAWGRVFMFPEEFAGLRGKLQIFVETLFEPNPFRKDAPVFRGTFFSSGKQMGQPFDLVLRKVRSMLGLASFEEPEVQEEKEDAYFVRDLFAKVLKIDRDLVRRTKGAGTKAARTQMILTGALAVVALLSCLWIGVSYARLQRRIGSAKNAAVQVRQSADDGLSATSLAGLEHLRREVSTPWRAFPLTAANSAREAANRIYLETARSRILQPIEEEMAARLDQAEQLDADQTRSALRGEILLTDPRQKAGMDLKEEDLAAALAAFGFPDLAPGSESIGQLHGLAAAFLERGEPLVLAEERREALRFGAERLADTHDRDEFFRGVVAAASRVERDLTLDSLAGGQTILKADRLVRAAFTKAGYENSVKDQLDNIEKTIRADDRLILAAGGRPVSGAPTKEDVVRLYQQRYPLEWAAFFSSIQFPSYSDCSEAAGDLKKLKSPAGSPLLKLLQASAAAADLGEVKIKGITVHESDDVKPINAALLPLTGFSAAPKGEAPPLEAYADHLSGVYDQVAQCADDSDFEFDMAVLRKAEDWPQEYADRFGGNPVAQAMGALLQAPVRSAKALKKSRGESLAGEALKKGVLDPFRRDLEGKYPFGKGEPADPQKVAEFLGPSGKLATYVQDQQASESADPGMDRLMVKLSEIRKGLTITDSGLRATFTLEAEGVRSLGTPEGKENLARIDRVTLMINGSKALVDRMNHPSATVTWSTDDSDSRCGLYLEYTAENRKIGSLERDGDVWTFFALCDLARRSRDESGAWRLTWVFEKEGVEASFRLTMKNGADPPFAPESAFRTLSPRG